MPFTVTACFEQYCAQQVDLDPDEIDKAGQSLNLLKGQIAQLPGRDNAFPPLYDYFDHCGAFARRTKARPLDRVGLMVLLNGIYTASQPDPDGGDRIRVTRSNSPLWAYTRAGDLDSAQVLAMLQTSLSNVWQYQNAAPGPEGKTVRLHLQAAPWTFVIIPAFPVSNRQREIEYYLAPDGQGAWQRCDPRRVQKQVTELNRFHRGRFAALVRLMKTWNAARMPLCLNSYHLEAILLNAFTGRIAMSDVHHNLALAFEDLAVGIQNPCPDPQGLGPDLDQAIPHTTRIQLSQAAAQAAQTAALALEHESRRDHHQAIDLWQALFPGFPAYAA
ncbi:MAG: hypothetical protein VB089_19770 [Anaerolineaceae bacterium]|nr:hypothetical protein [Anaerolineaceae bacterium]